MTANRMILAWMACALLALPARAAHKSRRAGVVNPGTLVVLLRNPWQSLDPAVAYDIGSQFIQDNVFESLLAFGDGPSDLRPWLAAQTPSVENGLVSPDRLTYAFPIRQDIRFHDGSKLTPEDVRYSFLRDILIGEKISSPSLLLRPLLGVDSLVGADGRWKLDPSALAQHIVIDGDKVVFKLNQPFPGFLKLIAAWPVITSKRWCMAHEDWDGDLAKLGDHPPQAAPYLTDHAMGTGPFQVESVDSATREIRLARNGKYWNKKAKLKAVVLRPIRSDALRALMLENGDADYAYMERPDLELLEGSSGITLLDDIPAFESGETFFFTFHIDPQDNPRIGSGRLDGKGIPPDFFMDQDVRAGFAYAFDSKQYLQRALGGKAQRAAGPIPESLLEAPNPPNRFDFDPEQAKAAFQKAYRGRLWKTGFELTLGYPRGSIRRHIACELLKAGVEKINPRFKVDMEALPPRQYAEAYRAHKIPLFIQNWAADYPGAHSIAFQFFDSEGFFPQAQAFSDPTLDKIERAASREHDPQKRRDLYLDLEHKAQEQVLQIYTYQPQMFKVVRSWLKGFDRNQNVNGLGFLNLLYFQPLYKK